MNAAQKTFLFSLFIFLIEGACFGIIDFTKNNDIFNVLSLIYGLQLTSVPTLFFNFTVMGSITNVLTFLVAIPTLSITLFYSGYVMGKRSTLSLTVLLVMGVIYALILSATWDTVFLVLVMNYWDNSILTQNVIWLPFAGGGIIFSWRSGVYFITVRFILSILFSSYVAAKLTVQKQIRGRIYER